MFKTNYVCKSGLDHIILIVNYRRNIWRVIMKTLRFQKGPSRCNSTHILLNHVKIKSKDSHTFSREPT